MIGGHRKSHGKGLHFLLLTSQRVFNCFIITLFSLNASSLLENHQIPILKYILIELGLNPLSRSEHEKSRLFEFQMMNVAILFLDGVNIDRSYLSRDQ